MVNWKSKKLGDILLLCNGIAAIVLINLLASFVFYRIDLTEEKRYTIKPQTKEILAGLDDKVYIEVYLAGDLNAGFTRLQRAIRETVEEFRIYSHNRVSYRFIDPAEAQSNRARGEFMADLAAKGIQATNVIDNKNGQRVEKLIFPGALVSYGAQETGVMLLKGNKASTAQEEINQSIEGLEYELASAIYRLTNSDPRRIGLVKGHGELDSVDVAGLYDALSAVYDVSNVTLSSGDVLSYDALVIAKPTTSFPDADLYALDQFIMQGGKVVFLLDKLDASMEKASEPGYLAFPYETGLDEMLFRYGVRINMDLIQDQNAAFYPVVTGQSGASPRMQLVEWPYFPLIVRFADHAVTRNLDAVLLRFASTIDTVKAPGIRKTPLLFSSQYARTIGAPVQIDINEFREQKTGQFQKSFLPVAYLLEGRFTSIYKNRFLPAGVMKNSFRQESVPTKLMVVADGDVARNEVNRRSGNPHPLGFDPFTNYTYANDDLILNMLAFLTEENGLIVARNKEVAIRPLDRNRVATEKTQWQIVNVVLPLVLTATYGIARSFVRKRRYTSFP
ncbi:MAG TPA: gliding motility-associated ABC transporter substrate-binding protein GldG [Chryseosolibacter sp.]|nr:gliding motility-associated ABC transporter substrate-binding protein GldG [Chryseosolibacter sp.]